MDRSCAGVLGRLGIFHASYAGKNRIPPRRAEAAYLGEKIPGTSWRASEAPGHGTRVIIVMA